MNPMPTSQAFSWKSIGDCLLPRFCITFGLKNKPCLLVKLKNKDWKKLSIGYVSFIKQSLTLDHWKLVYNSQKGEQRNIAFCQGDLSQFPSTVREWNEGTGSLASYQSQESRYNRQIYKSEWVSLSTALLQWPTSFGKLPPDHWKWLSMAIHCVLYKWWYRQETLGHQNAIEHILTDHWQTWMEEYQQPGDPWSMEHVNTLWDCGIVVLSQNRWGR